MNGRGLRLRAARDPHGVTLANWQDPPFNRWAFLHLDELLTMAPIRRRGPVRELARAERDVGGVTLEVRGERLKLDQMLQETFTDGFLVLHEGMVVTEQYADAMSADTLAPDHVSVQIPHLRARGRAGLQVAVHHVGDLGVLIVDVALFARFEVGGHGLAAFLDHAGDVPGKFLHVEGSGRFRGGVHSWASIFRPEACFV